jgi:6-phospho-beta-glucosidase
VINFSNRSALVTEARLKHTRTRIIGPCNLPINMLHTVAGLLGATPDPVELDYVGLNHLSWVKGASLDGQTIQGNLVPIFEDGQAHHIEVTLR